MHHIVHTKTEDKSQRFFFLQLLGVMTFTVLSVNSKHTLGKILKTF